VCVFTQVIDNRTVICVWENQSELNRMLKNQKYRRLELVKINTDEIQTGKTG
jgi:hypothetical protein